MKVKLMNAIAEKDHAIKPLGEILATESSAHPDANAIVSEGTATVTADRADTDVD